MPPIPLKVFISYAHEDKVYFEVFLHELRNAVKPSPNFTWEIWEDHLLLLGENWHAQIQQRLHEADAAIFLVSNGFLASDYIRHDELGVLIERQESDKVLFFPVLFGPCRLTNWPELSAIQVFQPEGRAYKEPDIKDFSFSDLVDEKDVRLPNPMRTRYLNDFVESVEEAVLASNIKPAEIVQSSAAEAPKAIEHKIYLDPDIYKHTCDRIPHRDHFLESERSEKKVQFFLIHGQEEQSPFGLSKRFHYQLTRRLDDLKIESNPGHLHGIYAEIDFTDSTKEPQFKSNLIQRLFCHFRVDPDKHAPPVATNLGVIVENSPLLGDKSANDIVSIYLRVIREEWRDFIPTVLGWFIHDFCAEATLPDTAPRFCFFVSLIYEEEHCEADCEKMLAAMQAVPKLVTLPELTPVHKKLIIEWMRQHKAAGTTAERKALFTKYFHEDDMYDMEIVETKLAELIRTEILK